MKSLIIIVSIVSVALLTGCDTTTTPISSPKITFTKFFDDSSWAEGNDVVQTSDDGYIVLVTERPSEWERNIVLLRTDAFGNRLWRRSSMNGAFSGAKILQASDGNFLALLHGVFPQKSYTSLHLFDPLGTPRSMQPMNGDGYWTYGRDMIQTRDGGFIVCGEKSSEPSPASQAIVWKISPTLQPQWKALIGHITDQSVAYSVLQNDDGSYLVAGARIPKTVPASTAFNPFVFKLDSLGNLIWEKYWSGNITGTLHSVAATMDGGFIFAGQSIRQGDQTIGVLLLSVDDDGKERWHREYFTTGLDEALSVVQSGDGGFLVSGMTSINPERMLDALALKTDRNGKLLWAKSIGRKYLDWFVSLRKTNDNGFILTGMSDQDSISTNRDVLLVKIDGSGNPCSPIIKPRK